MRIERAEITVKVDMTDTADYFGPVERGQARRFRPAFAMISPSGDVWLHGHRVNGQGAATERRSVILYPADEAVPECVRQARDLAARYRALAHDAWTAYVEVTRDRQSV